MISPARFAVICSYLEPKALMGVDKRYRPVLGYVRLVRAYVQSVVEVSANSNRGYHRMASSDTAERPNMDEAAETVVLTVPELADRLKIGRTRAYALCREAGFPSIKVGSQIRIPVRLLDEWLETAADLTAKESGR